MHLLGSGKVFLGCNIEMTLLIQSPSPQVECSFSVVTWSYIKVHIFQPHFEVDTDRLEQVSGIG
jgi:hypothetical protein